MAFIDPASLDAQLSAIWHDSDIATLATAGQKYVLMSDMHLGDGGRADDLRKNEQVLQEALAYYALAGYTLLLLGDIEELWQFDLGEIVQRYQCSVYAAMQRFGAQSAGAHRVGRIYGNHDHEWGYMRDPARPSVSRPAYAVEGIKLADAEGQPRFLLVHGHQGSIDADKYAWMSRFFVRLFKLVEPLATRLGIYGASSAAKSGIPGDYERIFYAWAKAHQVILICGHTHRAIFESKSWAERLEEQIAGLRSQNSDRSLPQVAVRENIKEIVKLQREWRDEKKKGRVIEPVEQTGEPLPCYFNTGCTLYTDGLTAIEIGDGAIRLVKWDRNKRGSAAREMYHQDSQDSVVARVAGQR
jgi:UDP-2,3-diacylglucosamine pyrophosphatase LpxH